MYFQNYNDLKRYFRLMSSNKYDKYKAYCDYFGTDSRGCKNCFFYQLNRNATECVGNKEYILSFLLKSFPNLILEEDKK